MIDLDGFVEDAPCGLSQSQMVSDLESGFEIFYEEDFEHTCQVSSQNMFDPNSETEYAQTFQMKDLPIKSESVSFAFFEKHFELMQTVQKRAGNFDQDDLNFWEESIKPR